MKTQTLCVDCKEVLVAAKTTVTSDGHTYICMSCEGKRISKAMTSIYQRGGIRG